MLWGVQVVGPIAADLVRLMILECGQLRDWNVVKYFPTGIVVKYSKMSLWQPRLELSLNTARCLYGN